MLNILANIEKVSTANQTRILIMSGDFRYELIVFRTNSVLCVQMTTNIKSTQVCSKTHEKHSWFETEQ